MDPDRFDRRHVRRLHRAHRRPLRVLRRLVVHSQSVLHLVQSCSMCYYHGSVRTPGNPGVEPPLGPRAKQHGRCLLHVLDHVCCWEPYARGV